MKYFDDIKWTKYLKIMDIHKEFKLELPEGIFLV
jgi:hypothetical protein